MHRGRHIAVAIVLALSTAGCGEDPPTGPSVGGTYPLSTVNGQALPATLADSTVVHSGSFTIDNLRTCLANTTVTRPGQAQAQASALCSFGGTIASFTIQWQGGPFDTGSTNGNELTLTTTEPGCVMIPGADCEGVTWVYSR